uniref:lysozyme n=1 Tax=Fundulus heteroclitus TaxID=8078 RepID=A0A3Q2QTP6_FUNHE
LRDFSTLYNTGTQGVKVFRCLAHMQKHSGEQIHYPQCCLSWLSSGVCLTQHESNFNTRAINRNTDGSTDYGIFQINSKWWCSDGGVSRGNGCGIRCSELQTDDVEKAIRCAKRVVDDPNGIGAWVAWKAHCQNRDLSSYLRGCNL